MYFEHQDAQIITMQFEMLVLLCKNFPRMRDVANLSLAALHYTFPHNFIESLTWKAHCKGFFRALELLPEFESKNRNTSRTSLKNYNIPVGDEYYYIHHCIVSSWALQQGHACLSTLNMYLTAMENIVASLKDSIPTKKAKTTTAIESNHTSTALATVVDGEHAILRSLTVNSFQQYLVSVLLCGIATYSRVIPRESYFERFDTNPYCEIVMFLNVIRRCALLFIDADICGVNLTKRT